MSDADPPKKQMARLWGFDKDISTLEARIAELTRRHEADLSRASEITRGALDDRDAARARIAELEMERELDEAREKRVTRKATADDAWSWLPSAVAEVERLRGFLDEMADDVAAARADLDEAVRLLRDCLDGWLHGADMVTPMHAARAYLARHPTPDNRNVGTLEGHPFIGHEEHLAISVAPVNAPTHDKETTK